MMAVVPGLTILSLLVAFTLHQWYLAPLVFGLVIGMIVLRPFRNLALMLLISCMGIVSWNFGAAFLRNLANASTVFHVVYITVIGVAVARLLMVTFAHVVIVVCALGRDISSNRRALLSGEVGRIVERFDAHQVLEVPPGASSGEVRAAYRKQMQRYHPDRVAHLGVEQERAAHERVLLIQRAAAKLTRSAR